MQRVDLRGKGGLGACLGCVPVLCALTVSHLILITLCRFVLLELGKLRVRVVKKLALNHSARKK